MNGFSRYSVLDQMTTELATRRRTAHARRAAYLALAQAILAEDTDLSATYDHQSQQLDRTPLAA